MSAPVVPVFTPAGEAFLRADTAAHLDIAPHSRLTAKQYADAVREDYCRNRDDKRSRA